METAKPFDIRAPTTGRAHGAKPASRIGIGRRLFFETHENTRPSFSESSKAKHL